MNPSEMTDEQLNVAIAEACGWKIDDELEDGAVVGTAPGGGWDMVPNYSTDLNAMATAEATLTDREKEEYEFQILISIEATSATFATARQRAVAFLKVKHP